MAEDYLPRSIMYASRMRYLKSREGGDQKNTRRGSLEMFAASEDTSGALGCLEIKEPCRWVGGISQTYMYGDGFAHYRSLENAESPS